ALDRLRVRVDQQLRRVEALAGLGLVRPLHAGAVARARADARQVAVPVEDRALGQLDRRFLAAVVEETKLDALGGLREEREVRAVPVPCRPERERLAGTDPPSAPHRA